MHKPLMPKAIAIWLIEHTSLTFNQIADFCCMHPLEIKGIADGEVSQGIIAMSPVNSGELTLEEIKMGESNPDYKIKISEKALKHQLKTKKSKYTPVARRQDKPDAIAWLVKHYPQIKDTEVSKLIGTTKKTIEAIREKTHWNILNIKAKDPALLGICSQTELNNLIAILNLRAEQNIKTDNSEEE
jgi:uncharacterized protein